VDLEKQSSFLEEGEGEEERGGRKRSKVQSGWALHQVLKYQYS